MYADIFTHELDAPLCAIARGVWIEWVSRRMASAHASAHAESDVVMELKEAVAFAQREHRRATALFRVIKAVQESGPSVGRLVSARPAPALATFFAHFRFASGLEISDSGAQQRARSCSVRSVWSLP